MLEPPISQRDVDEKTVFNTRGGGTARVVGIDDISSMFHFVAEYFDGRTEKLTQHGTWRSCLGGWRADIDAHPDDLISRLPTEEPEMEKQVVFEDRRGQAPEQQTKYFKDLPIGSLFEAGSAGVVCMKIGDDARQQLSEDSSFGILTTSQHCDCKTLPHLRLRLVLEDKE